MGGLFKLILNDSLLIDYDAISGRALDCRPSCRSAVVAGRRSSGSMPTGSIASEDVPSLPPSCKWHPEA
jgi:hypothetical protein